MNRKIAVLWGNTNQIAVILLFTGRTRRQNCNFVKYVVEKFDYYEGITLINILILVKILNAWVAGRTKTVETCFIKLFFSYLVLFLFNTYISPQDSVRKLSKRHNCKLRPTSLKVTRLLWTFLNAVIQNTLFDFIFDRMLSWMLRF